MTAVPESTPSTVDLINRCLEDQSLQIAVAPPPPLEPGQPVAKETIRRRMEEWLDGLPGDDAALIEIGRMLPGSSDE